MRDRQMYQKSNRIYEKHFFHFFLFNLGVALVYTLHEG